MAKEIKTKWGKTITLLNPHEKGKKFAAELRNKTALTNDFEFKRNEDGSYRGLTDTQLAYRSGYLDARNDEAKLFKWKQKKSK